MSNIYFPDEEITFNDIYFVCSMIERTARHIKQPNIYVVQKIGKEGLERQLSIANTLHCLNPEQVVDDWKDEYQLQSGNRDVTAVNADLVDKIPTELQMGKVYARLVSALTPADGNFAEGIMKVYSSPVCETIDNYNSSAYYEPSYVQIRALQNGAFI